MITVKYLKLCFLSCVVIMFTILMWLATQPLNPLVEHINWMFFYEYEPIYKKNFTFTIGEHVNCKDATPFLVILVTSRPKDTLSRQAIRLSWGSVNSWLGHNVKTLFLLGKEPTIEEDRIVTSIIKEESKLYGDIISQDFLDTYDNLTLKTIMAFRWISEFCPNTTFVMKADSDVFINVGNLVTFLQKFNSSDSLFTGYPFIENSSQRGDYFSKAYISYEEYPFRFYPPYCSGLGYLLSGKLALKMYEMMSHVKPIRFEDVYVGICLKVLKVDVHIPENRDLFMLLKIKFNICRYKRVCAVHGLSSNEILTVWQAIQKNPSSDCE
ncbi:UDP-GalNAc:beta-1,3-N-acetylgalactosaminyltransferase 1 [Ambystoma mexicanum]|uniref:UDP-GalNAc:beta-1, 3-N-acetylgalactosaminyltransferase 1 n=1 Tax=Ambystoma mexicanum TaxID=8296 RepID=UPI0037E730EF